MPRKMLLCCIAVVCFATAAFADNNNDLNFSVSMDCNHGQYCSADPSNNGDPASASADFTHIGQPWTFQTTRGDAIQWQFNGDEYDATFGRGGTFYMTGPSGLTFTGVVTSGTAQWGDFGFLVQVSYSGEWSNGVFATGEAESGFSSGGENAVASLNSQVSPEPSSLLLLGTGVVGVFLRKRF
jgi:hypothetical protein